MARAANGVAAVQIEILPAVACPDPRAIAPLDREVHFFVGVDLTLLLELLYFVKSHSNN